MVEIKWQDPPERGSWIGGTLTPIVAALKKNPGKWALVREKVSSSSAQTPWKKQGCEALVRRSNPGETPPRYDVYARWPETVKPLPVGRAAVEKAVSSGTALKPAPAAARPPLPAPKASGGYSQFLANQRAGTVAAAE